MTDWVRMIHKETGGVTSVPSRAVDSYKRRGWTAENYQGSTGFEPTPKAISKSKPKENPAPITPESSNESKEDG